MAKQRMHLPRNNQNKEAEVIFFNQQAELEQSLWFEESSTEQILAIAPFLKAQKGKLKILNAGCGSGNLSLKLAKLGHEVIGVDLSKKQIELLMRWRHPDLKGKIGDLENKTLFNSKTFDVIFCSHIMHHFPSLNKVVNNFDYWLKSKGIIFLAEPNNSNLFNPLSNIAGDILSWINPSLGPKPGTINEINYSYKDYQKVLENQGFKIYFFGGLSPLFFSSGQGLRSALIFVREILYQIFRVFPHPYGSRIIVLEAKK